MCFLLGNPVSHSVSPLIHNTAFRELELPIRYEARSIEEGDLESILHSIDGDRVVGANVTLPHKQSVLKHLHELTDTAAAVGAVNTIFRRNGRLVGDNTDVGGFLAPIEHLSLQRARVLILGAGGAARAVSYAARHHLDASSVTVAARNLNAARAIDGVHACSWLEGQTMISSADLIVNATPIGMYPDTDASPLPDDQTWKSGQVFYDLIYNPDPTRTTEQARSNGATGIGGLPMLVAQAAAAFKIWTGREMPVDAVLEALKDAGR